MAEQAGTKHRRAIAKAKADAAAPAFSVATKSPPPDTKGAPFAREQVDEPPTAEQDALLTAQVERQDDRVRARQEADSVPVKEASVIEQRFSFVVRLTVDAQGQTLRAEIEHAQSGKKATFPGLDMKRLADFMRAHISSPAAPKTAPEASRSGKALEPAQESPTSGLNLIVFGVQIFRRGIPDVTIVTLDSSEPFVVQARFRLQGAGGLALAGQNAAFEIKGYATNLASSKHRLLAAYKASLVKGVLDYAADMEVTGLSEGEYHLTTVVTLRESSCLLGRQEGPIIEVMKAQSSEALDTPEAAGVLC